MPGRLDDATKYARMPSAGADVTIATIEDSVVTIVREATLSSVQERFVEQAGVAVERADYDVLRGVAEHGPVRVTDLARQLGVDPSTASRQVKTLERQGMLARDGDPRDGRVAHLALTPAGGEAWRARSGGLAFGGPASQPCLGGRPHGPQGAMGPPPAWGLDVYPDLRRVVRGRRVRGWDGQHGEMPAEDRSTGVDGEPDTFAGRELVGEETQVDPAVSADDDVGGAVVAETAGGREDCGDGVEVADLGHRLGPGAFQDDPLVPAVRSGSVERVVAP